ncbi:hypothetical protein ABEB36_015524 [Hypothenemus hampei]|uniref:Uncharacterized protein n=1 Tax=Hypothenemus hampei TaxID=57062 RepID=A0ABD1DZP7_HYPHA
MQDWDPVNKARESMGLEVETQTGFKGEDIDALSLFKIKAEAALSRWVDHNRAMDKELKANMNEIQELQLKNLELEKQVAERRERVTTCEVGCQTMIEGELDKLSPSKSFDDWCLVRAQPWNEDLFTNTTIKEKTNESKQDTLKLMIVGPGEDRQPDFRRLIATYPEITEIEDGVGIITNAYTIRSKSHIAPLNPALRS